MAETLTIEQVSDLLQTVVAGIRVGDHADDRVYSLREVADRTGFALTSLEDDCRAGKFEHTKRGRSLGMTSRQIALLVTQHRAGGDLAPAGADELAMVAAATRKSGARRSGNQLR